jgi:hypothetical protein
MATHPRRGDKSAFILAQPITLTASEIVAAARVSGLALSTQTVYSVRSRRGLVSSTHAIAVPTQTKLGQLRRLVLEVGYDAAREVLDAVAGDLGIGAARAEREYRLPVDDASSSYEVSSIRVIPLHGHELVRVWNRGALAGELVVEIGDGETIAAAFGLAHREDAP